VEEAVAASRLEVTTGKVLADCRGSPLMMCRESEARQNPDFWHFSLSSVLSTKDRLLHLPTIPTCLHIVSHNSST
jgi:hypothetical protein